MKHNRDLRYGRIDPIILIKEKRSRPLGGRMDLIRSLDAMSSRVVHKALEALGALDDTGEDEGYGRECGRGRASIPEDGLGDRRSSRSSI